MDNGATASDRRSPPPGQRYLDDFPQFGVAAFARRPLQIQAIHIEFFGALERTVTVSAAELATLPRAKLRSDFHCAAGWSHADLDWEGVRFQDIWTAFVEQLTRIASERCLIVLRCQDGFRTSLPLSDLLAPDVLIADRLNGEPLTRAHGAPVRLVAPAHYGYKSAKHLVRVEVRSAEQDYRPLLPRFMEHPRARVHVEERGQSLVGCCAISSGRSSSR